VNKKQTLLISLLLIAIYYGIVILVTVVTGSFELGLIVPWILLAISLIFVFVGFLKAFISDVYKALGD